MSLRLGIDLGLFHILVEQNGQSVSAAELAKRSGAELLLVGIPHKLCDYLDDGREAKACPAGSPHHARRHSNRIRGRGRRAKLCGHSSDQGYHDSGSRGGNKDVVGKVSRHAPSLPGLKHHLQQRPRVTNPNPTT